MKILSIFSFAIASLFVFSACEEDPDPPPQKTKTELITLATWKFSTAVWGGTDVTASLPSCYKDNTLTFTSSSPGIGAGVADEGATKCNAGDPQSTPFTWSFLANETQLQVSTPLLPGGGNTLNINTLTETQLVLSQMWAPPGGGASQNTVITFTH